MTIYTVLLKDGTVGEINGDTINGQDAEAFMGDVIRIHLHDDNGNPIEVEGRLTEVLSAREY